MEQQAVADSQAALAAVALAAVGFQADSEAARRAAAVVAGKPAADNREEAAVAASVEAVEVADSGRVIDRGPSLVDCFAINCFQTKRGHRLVSSWYQS